MAGIPLSEIGWSARIRNPLDARGYKTTDDLIRAGEKEVSDTPNIGRGSMNRIRDQLEARGLSFSDKPAPPKSEDDLEAMFAILEQRVARHLAEQARNLDERINAIAAAVNATQKANGLDQMMELLLGIRKAIDLRLDDLMLAVRLAKRPGVNGAEGGMT